MNTSSGRLKFVVSSFVSVALGIVMVAALAAPSRVEADATSIVFASGPDDTGTVQRLVDAFNEAHAGKIQVQWRQMSRESDTHRDQLVKELASGSSTVDLIASDVIWTAELVRNDWIEDLTDRFYDAYDRDAFLAPALGSASYRLRIWGTPWYTDAGMLFYRKDRLAASGFSGPPATWDELGSMARKVMQDSGTRYGFVFQGAEYEGGVANAAEFIWSAGGEIVTTQLTVAGVVVNTAIETDAVRVGSEAAIRGLDIARGLVADNIAPAEVADFREKDALDAFAAGDAVFLRSWPYAHGVLRQAGFEADQLGIASLPAASTGGRSASCLGGWNLMINAASSAAEKDAAWALVRYLTDAAQQKRAAREAGLLPVLAELYDDPGFVSEIPVMALGKQVFTAQMHARPMSPFYSEISASIANAFNRTLRGEITGAKAAQLLDKELRVIVARNR